MEAVVEYEYVAVQDDELSLKVGNVIKNVSTSEDGWLRGELEGKKGVFPENFVQIIKNTDKDTILRDKTGQQKREAPQRKSVRELASKFKDGVPMGLGGPPKKKVEKKKCKVLYDYKPENEDELELQVGDIVDFIKEVEDGWYEGALGDKNGVFPSNFVEHITVTEETVVEDHHIVPEPSSGGDTSEGENKASKPKKVMGVGLGNIFQGGPIKLRSVGGSKKAAAQPPPPEKDKPPEIKESTRPPPLPPSNDVTKREKSTAGERAVVRFSYAADQPDELNLKEGDVVNIIDRHLEDDGWWKGEVHGRIGVFPDNFVELLPAEEVILKPKKPPPPVVTSNTSKSSNLYPKLPEKSDNHDNKKTITESKNSYKKDQEIEKGLGSIRKPNIPPPIGKKPSSHKSSEPPKLPESTKPDHKSILSSSREGSKKKDLIPHSQPEERNHNHVNDENVHFEDIESNSQKLVHLTASRAKGPKKRPPSSVFTPMENEDKNVDAELSRDNTTTEKIKTPNSFEKRPIHEPLHDIKEHRESRDIKENRDYRESPRDIKEHKDIRDNKDTRDVHSRDNRGDTRGDNRDSRHIPPQRPPAPDMSSSSNAGASQLQKIVEDLQREVRELRSNTVSKSAFNELKTELDSMKSLHTKKLRELMNEVDEEKKLRLNTQVEIERIKKLLAETNV